MYTHLMKGEKMSNNISKEDFIKNTALTLGANACGIGSIERFSEAPEGFSPLDHYKDCKSVIAVGMALPKGLYEVPSRIIYAHFNSQICNSVDSLELQLCVQMEEKLGCTAVPMPCDWPNEYWDEENLTGKGLISMRHTAVLCGLGWNYRRIISSQICAYQVVKNALRNVLLRQYITAA
jgi:epoxyqueuosine reductase QueG